MGGGKWLVQAGTGWSQIFQLNSWVVQGWYANRIALLETNRIYKYDTFMRHILVKIIDKRGNVLCATRGT